MVRLSPIAALLIALPGAMLASALVARGQVASAQVNGPHEWKTTAERLQRGIVTVRIRRADVPQPPAADQPLADQLSGEQSAKKAEASVTICTGFCVAPGKIITATLAATDDRIRFTLPGGLQSDARLLVVDEYSGLSLLSCERKELDPLPLAANQPDVGEYVMAGAAWGVERPVVSLGIIGATERTLSGLLVPPLLQCDLRTVETSSGSPLANRQAEVVGIVMAVEEPEARRGWTYAIPATHIRRLLRSADAVVTKPGTEKSPNVLILKRRRPIVGMVLESSDEAILVQRLTAGGPAEKAGLKIGDRILTADGVAIRSVYQAVLPTLYKQPGDSVRYRVLREEGERELEVILGGGVELPKLSQNDLGQYILPRVEVGRGADGNYFAQSGRSGVREVFSPPLPQDVEPAVAPVPTAEQKIDLLMKSLERYQAVIELQQKEILKLREEMKKK
ncbi:putative periplasmic serine endoprotease DegP-like precursor [Anatilimnocola aggregata]|uniref:Putative periplasmic serine endoprotease DegP-like n=1 Tax=Anatilimnocola aggregata TaxID=2528021 RepID=A0A517YBF4_9BACT|nr:S1C family serine protease [Anatilimnocola aggregata]QDU27544.1 putative periplasmic serine endoprotease DegP-like precursor [Anatilimnocola aggregata]